MLNQLWKLRDVSYFGSEYSARRCIYSNKLQNYLHVQSVSSNKLPNFLLFCNFWQILHLIENHWLHIWILLDRFSIWKSEVFPFQKIGNGIPQFSRYFVCFLYFATNINRWWWSFLVREQEWKESRKYVRVGCIYYWALLPFRWLLCICYW